MWHDFLTLFPKRCLGYTSFAPNIWLHLILCVSYQLISSPTASVFQYQRVKVQHLINQHHIEHFLNTLTSTSLLWRQLLCDPRVVCRANTCYSRKQNRLNNDNVAYISAQFSKSPLCHSKSKLIQDGIYSYTNSYGLPILPCY